MKIRRLFVCAFVAWLSIPASTFAHGRFFGSYGSYGSYGGAIGASPIAAGAPAYSYGAAAVYSAPAYSYAAPAYSYAAPAYSYAAPAYSYVAPAVYGAPAYSYSAPASYALTTANTVLSNVAQHTPSGAQYGLQAGVYDDGSVKDEGNQGGSSGSKCCCNSSRNDDMAKLTSGIEKLDKKLDEVLKRLESAEKGSGDKTPKPQVGQVNSPDPAPLVSTPTPDVAEQGFNEAQKTEIASIVQKNMMQAVERLKKDNNLK